LQGTRAILPFGSGKIRPGRVVLKIGEPIQTSSLTLRDRSAVTAQVRDQIANMLA
jgi:hypothetical protein